eukprot:gnl/TRDRNA2_/TRDRNA2_193224_c0_seq1.p1 gnl/TRDRNA2_/TRDRNA2_193224_c0~~gnl/TRDRNA2_/TRDRNA2_193224_c0_seq1.p1  ORF type:complete len:242 (-),score=49.31 gnl/TRDRNA2_/TRDRNA2_193224_c0_seq1:63-788(-)
MGQVGCCSSQPGGCCASERNGEDAETPPTGPKPVGQEGADLVAAQAALRTPGMNASEALPSQDKGADKVPTAAKGNDPAPGGDSAAGGQESQSVTYEDGSTYTGQILAGKRHGKGVWQSRTGQYDGEWMYDQQEGTGRQTWSDGRVYEGQFSGGKFSGHGSMVWHTQKGKLVYEGQYIEDLKHGKGKFVWADGRTYDGEWQKGKRWGKATYVNVRGEKKVGIWTEDKFQGWVTDENAQTTS